MGRVTKSGKVISFSTSTTKGRIEVDTKQYEFLSTSFLAIRRPRYPRPGETVEVTLRTTEAGCSVLAVCARDH